MSLHVLPDNKEVELFYHERKNYDSDSGIDLFVVSDTIFYPGETKLIDLAIKCKMTNKDNLSIPYYLYPRSSIYKTPLRLANSVGIIDKDYRGNIKAAIQYVPTSIFLRRFFSKNDNFRNSYNNSKYILKKGDRILQICAPDLQPIKLILTDKLDNTVRNEGGFGSTN